jgi:flavin reductase (DIM6/NTAB) family NADH-FMN oxidoreductase RutF
MADLRTVERQRFASIMAAFPSGVAIITTASGDREPKGLTTTAVCSVSADPPLLLVCIDRGSRTLPALVEAKRFVINFIRLEYEEVCRAFASKGDDKFANLLWETTRSGMPLLREHVVSWAECATVQEIEAGDHIVLIGRVEDGDVTSDAEVAPLVYYRRAWGRWHPHEDGR